MYIDTHCHLAWDVDDGIESREEAICALQGASRDGIREIIATPHFIPGSHTKQDIEDINLRIEELRQLAKEYEITIYKGAEVFLNHDYLDMVDEGMVNTLHDSKYLLVEFDVRKEINDNMDVEDMLYELTIRNYVPVIAHVERYFHKRLDLKRVQQWIDMGCVIQVNRTSIMGLHGKCCEENARILLEHGMVHLVASDAHRSSGSRICMLSDAAKRIEQITGKENARLLCLVNPRAVVEDHPLTEMVITKRGFFAKLLKKR